MARLDPAVAEIRSAVRRASAPARSEAIGADGPLALVACSGGADSMALGRGGGVRRAPARAGGPVWSRSTTAAARSAERAGRGRLGPAEGFDPVEVATVVVGAAGRAGGGRAGRPLRGAGTRRRGAHGASTCCSATPVTTRRRPYCSRLLRGAGLRGLAGMPARRDVDGVTLGRPLLGVARGRRPGGLRRPGPAVVGGSAQRRSGVRAPARAVPSCSLWSTRSARAWSPTWPGPRASPAADAAVSRRARRRRAPRQPEAGRVLRCGALAALPAAVRTRVLHGWARSLGAPGAALSHRHVDALDALVVAWHGQGAVHLPGAITVGRQGDRLAST